MTGLGAALIAMQALAGGVAGWMLVPWLSDFLLRRAYRRSHAWWWDSYRAYLAFKGSTGGEPLASARGEEGALGVWRDDAMRLAKSGGLARERVRALEDAGLPVDARQAVRCESEQEGRCSFAARPWQRAALAVLAGGGCCLLAMVRPGPLAAASLAACGLFMVAAVVCDLRARMLPLECCAVVAAAGAVFQVAVAGVAGLGAGLAFGLLVSVGCCAGNRLMGKGGSAPVGWGDVRCMAALSLATGAGAPFGFAVCYVGAALFSLAGLAARRLSVRDGIPMAPFLAVWLVCGAGSALAV